MKVVILAGGKGTRLAPLVENVPKPLAPVQGQPFLSILLRFLRSFQLEDITLAVGHMAEQFFSLEPELKKIAPHLSIQSESHPLGTGGALRQIASGLPREQSLLVLNGDTFFDIDLSDFMKLANAKNAIALHQVEDCSRYGRILQTNDLITGIQQGQPNSQPGWINAGIYLLNSKDICHLLGPQPCSIELELFPKLIGLQKLNGFRFQGDFIDIGIPEDYLRANQTFDFKEFSKLSGS